MTFFSRMTCYLLKLWYISGMVSGIAHLPRLSGYLQEMLKAMCRKIFIGATGQHCGKTTISLSLMHLARKKYARVGFMKPIGPKWIEFNGTIVDKDAAMFSSVFGVEEDVELMSPVTLTPGTTRRFLDGVIDATAPRN